MKNNLVSIIVPAYNAENCIEKCLNSLINQQYKNIEILIINDGSKDNTEKIVIDFQEKYPNIVKYFYKENSGVSDTRNFGLSNANGEYICFVDSDDYVEPNYVLLLLESIINNNSDMSISNFKVVGSNNVFNDSYILDKFDIFTKIDFLKHFINIEENSSIFGYLWRCMFKKNIIIDNNIYFKKKKISEDYLFMVEYVNLCNSVSVIHEELYNYVIHNGSVTSKFIDTLLVDLISVNDLINDLIIASNKDLYKNFVGIYCNSYLMYIQNTAKSNDYSIKTIYSNKKKYFYRYLKIRKKYHLNFRKKLKIALLLFDFNLEWLYIFLFKLKRCYNGKK